MNGSLYPISLIVVVLLAFAFYRSNSFKSMLFVLAIGIYIIYSHESGNTPSKIKNEIIESIDKSAKDFSKSRGVEKYDEGKIKKEVSD